MKFTYYGHSCFAVSAAGKTLLFDPFITPNPLAKAIDIKTIHADHILISHGHSDHCADAVEIARQTGATIVSNFEVTQWIAKAGAPNIHPMNHGGSWSLDFGRIKYVNAIHSSSMADGAAGGNPGGFVVETRDGNFYYSGDTALTMDMRLIGESTRLAFAVLCLGDTFTMGIEDAVKAAEFVRCNKIIGVHYDTFPPIKINRPEAIRKFREADKQLHLLGIGESLFV